MEEDSGVVEVMKPAERMPLTEECHHFSKLANVPWDLQKYWHQRYNIWQYYDYDIRMTDDAWFGVTPEPIANKIAEELADKAPATKTVIIDLFAGAGGNAIAFALSERWTHVIAIEKDAATLACAQHNAEVYEVAEYITFIHGDCFTYLDLLKTGPEKLHADLRVGKGNGEGRGKCSEGSDLSTVALFASPPWGGISYADYDVFDLETMQPYGLAEIHEACKPMAHALYLPRTSDLKQIAKLAPEGQKIDVCQYCMEGASKALVAYIPANEKTS